MEGQYRTSRACCLHLTIPRCDSWIGLSMRSLRVGGPTIRMPLYMKPSKTESSLQESQYGRKQNDTSHLASGHLSRIMDCKWPSSDWVAFSRSAHLSSEMDRKSSIEICSKLSSSEWTSGRYALERMSGSCISSPLLSWMLRLYHCNRCSMLCSLIGADSNAFLAIISRGLWSL